MRFFDLTQRMEESFSFGLRLLDLLPEDNEAQSNVARFLLQGMLTPHGFFSRSSRRPFEGGDITRFVSILQQVYRRDGLTMDKFGLPTFWRTWGNTN